MHPRKVYFFLTTIPRQDIPPDSSDVIEASAPAKGGKRVISPSLSNASVDGDAEAAEERKREALSPSPEVDLSVHDVVSRSSETDSQFVALGTSGRPTFPARPGLSGTELHPSHSEGGLAHSHRAVSPPLEGDEKEFTQTASIVRMRGMSLDDHPAKPAIEETGTSVAEQTEEERAKSNREAVEDLFGPHHRPSMNMAILSSPLIKPSHQSTVESEIKKEVSDIEMKEPISILGNRAGALSWDTREQEDVQIEDLDDLFMAY